ncbi:hypothetical protein DM50_3163 [Burkholderia mallei]|nr:hypothetical protein DM50_3163 [Burkholderia mallei]KOT10153.1 hypothetical protein DM77_2668 [Burkholderia mallei]
MIVIGRHDDQRIRQIDLRERGADRLVERHRVFERALRVRAVQRVVDAPAFDHQEIAVRILPQHVDRLRGHLREARLRRALALARDAVELVFEMARRAEKADQLARARLRELILRRDHRVALRLQLGEQVAPIRAAAPVGERIVRRPVIAAAAHQHVDAVAERRVVARAARHGLRGNVVLRVAMADVRVGRRGRRVRELGRRDRADRLAARLRELEQRRRRRAVAHAAAVHRLVAVRVAAGGDRARVRRHRQHLVVHLHAGHVRGHRRRAVRRLRVVREGLDARGARQLFHRQLAGFADLVEAARRHGGRPHPVAEEEDHVLRLARGVRRVAETAREGRRGERRRRDALDSRHPVFPCFPSSRAQSCAAPRTSSNTLLFSITP